jgi:hypothetical protein
LDDLKQKELQALQKRLKIEKNADEANKIRKAIQILVSNRSSFFNSSNDCNVHCRLNAKEQRKQKRRGKGFIPL